MPLSAFSHLLCFPHFKFTQRRLYGTHVGLSNALVLWLKKTSEMDHMLCWNGPFHIRFEHLHWHYWVFSHILALPFSLYAIKKCRAGGWSSWSLTFWCVFDFKGPLKPFFLYLSMSCKRWAFWVISRWRFLFLCVCGWDLEEEDLVNIAGLYSQVSQPLSIRSDHTHPLSPAEAAGLKLLIKDLSLIKYSCRNLK